MRKSIRSEVSTETPRLDFGKDELILRVTNLERSILCCDYQPLLSKRIETGILALKPNERGFSGTNHLHSLI